MDKCCEGREKALEVSSSGREACARGKSLGPYVRETCILHRVIRGRGVLESGGKRREVGAGQVFFIRAGTRIAYRADESDPWEYEWVNFQGAAADELLAHTDFDRNPVSPVLPERLGEQFAAIRALPFDAAGACEATGRLMILLAELMRLHPSPDPTGRDLTALAEACVSRRYSEAEFGIRELAEELGVDRSHLYRVFKRDTGVSPKEYLVNRRMARARELVRRGGMPVREIAWSVGYSDPLHFSAEYRRKFGLSPRFDPALE